MNKPTLAFVVAMAVFAAGCPSNHYAVTMTPRGDTIERELIFYRQDSEKPANAPPEPFDPKELAAITALYPTGGVMNKEGRYTASGAFVGRLPGDIGGSGWYKRLITSMGTGKAHQSRSEETGCGQRGE